MTLAGKIARLALLPAAMALATVAQARADEPSAMQRAFSTIPAAALTGDNIDKYFPAKVVDIAAARTLEPDRSTITRPVIGRILNVGAMIRPLRQLTYSGGMASRWEEFARVPFADIDAFAGFGNVPDDVSIWSLREETRARTLFDALQKRGFTPFDSDSAAGGDQVLTSGEPGALNFANRKPGDPWIGDLGMAFAVTRLGKTLIQAKSPASITTARNAPAASLTSLVPVSTVIKGIDAVTGKETHVIQAVLATPLIGVKDTVADVVLPDISQEERVRRMREQLERDQETGLPPYAMALIADIEAPGKSRGVAIALAYGDCAQATEGAARFVKRWQSVPLMAGNARSTMADTAPADAKTLTMPGTDGTCAAVITLTSPVPSNGDDLLNRPFRLILDTIMKRNFVAATIALKAR